MTRFQSLDGWRGLAAILVALYHFNFLNHLYDWNFLRNSYLFVDFFFVLSGFVISHAYYNKFNNFQQLGTFVQRRIARLLPLHWFILSLFVVLELVKLYLFQFSGWHADGRPFTGEFSFKSLISNIFLIHSLGLHDNLSWNYPSWSISVEFYTYIAFAVLGILSIQYKKFNKYLLYSLISVSFYIVFDNVDHLNEASYHYGIFRCFVGFFLGNFCYQYFKKTSGEILKNATRLEILLIIFLFIFISFYGAEKLSLLAPFFFAFTVYVFAFEQGKVSQLLKVKVLQNLGTWSYSIYMLHVLIILLIGRILNVFEFLTNKTLTISHVKNNGEIVELFYFSNTFLMDLVTLAYLFTLIYFSRLTYIHIEKKGNRLVNGWFSKKFKDSKSKSKTSSRVVISD